MLFVLLAASALFLFKDGGKGHALTAFIYEENCLIQEIDLLSLEQPELLRIAGGSVTVQAEHGGIQILSSDCPSQTCVHTGILTKGGDTAVCVPNQVAVTIRSDTPRQYQTY